MKIKRKKWRKNKEKRGERKRNKITDKTYEKKEGGGKEKRDRERGRD